MHKLGNQNLSGVHYTYRDPTLKVSMRKYLNSYIGRRKQNIVQRTFYFMEGELKRELVLISAEGRLRHEFSVEFSGFNR